MWLVPSFEDTRKAVLRDTASHRLLLRGARLADSRVADIVIADGMIISVSGGPTGDPSHAEVVDLSGYLVLPSLMNGTTAIRVHLDVGKRAGLWAVEALLDARGSLAGILDIQIRVAVLRRP